MTIYSKDPTIYPTAFSKIKGEETRLFYGVELEVEKKIMTGHIETVAAECLEDIGKYVNIRGDGSVPAGFEIVTIPATLRFHKEVLWKDFFDKSGKQLVATDKTGLHIHFSREATTTKQLAKCIYFVHETANAGFLSKIAGRRVWADAKWGKQRKKIYNTENEHNIVASETGMRRALGVSTHYNGDTCEMRIFKSNPTKAGVLQALEFVDAMLKYCGDCPDNEADLSYKKFIGWFSDMKMADVYPYLNDNLLLHGLVRRLKGWRVLLKRAV